MLSPTIAVLREFYLTENYTSVFLIADLRSWHGDCFFDEESSEWRRLEAPENRTNRDKPGISGSKRSVLVVGGTTTNEIGQKHRSAGVEKLVTTLKY